MSFPVLYVICEPFSEFMLETLASLDKVSSSTDFEFYALRDRRITPDVSALETAHPGLKVVDVDTKGHNPHAFMCRQACMLSEFHGRYGKLRYALSVPCNWLCVNRIDISSPLSVLSSSSDIFSIVLGGNPSSHTDVNPLFVPCASPVNGYIKMRTHSYDVPGLDRLDCPSIVDLYHVSAVYGREYGLSKGNRCGWDDKLMVLYPDKLTCSPSDGKPEPFRDVVGISPEYWDRHEVNQDGR